MRTLTRLALTACTAALLATTAGAAQAAKPPNPCLDPLQREALLCPDLVMKKPHGVHLDRTVVRGRVVLRAGNSIDNVGRGPAELFGVRTSRLFMRARQRIYRRGGGRRLGIRTGARLYFKYVTGQRRFWKFLYAAKFELWRLNSEGRRVRKVKRGPKVSYCLRDLRRTRFLARSPGRRVYPACNTNPRTRKVRLGTSVGWSDIYPPSYPEQYLDVTGLRGCFAYRHTADPRNGIYESNESNNTAQVIVRLPFRPGPQRCPFAGASDPSGGDDTPSPY
jgi:Lysyl oxidase